MVVVTNVPQSDVTCHFCWKFCAWSVFSNVTCSIVLYVTIIFTFAWIEKLFVCVTLVSLWISWGDHCFDIVYRMENQLAGQVEKALHTDRLFLYIKAPVTKARINYGESWWWLGLDWDIFLEDWVSPGDGRGYCEGWGPAGSGPVIRLTDEAASRPLYPPPMHTTRLALIEKLPPCLSWHLANKSINWNQIWCMRIRGKFPMDPLQAWLGATWKHSMSAQGIHRI